MTAFDEIRESVVFSSNIYLEENMRIVLSEGHCTWCRAPTILTHSTTRHKIEEAAVLPACDAMHFIPPNYTPHVGPVAQTV